METLAEQEIIAQFYDKAAVTPAFIALELEALELGHSTGTLNAAQEWLYVALASAKLSVSISRAQAKSVADQCTFERELADTPPPEKLT
jgi:hypothetical protein